MSKAQIMFTDLIIAVSVFIIIITIAFMSIESNKSNFEANDKTYTLQNKASVLSDYFVKQPVMFSVNSTGYGIVTEPNVLSMDKLNYLSNLDYSVIKSNLSLGYMDFNVKFYDKNNSLIKSIGPESSGNNQTYSVVRILAFPNGSNYHEVIANGTKYNLCETNLTGFYGRYYNLPPNGSHPDVGPAPGINITGVVTGLVNNTLPLSLGPNGSAYINQFDWFSDNATYNGSTYYMWDRIDPNVSFSNVSFWPVNESWPKDPHFFTVTWTAYIYANTSKNYTFKQSSDDDSWTFIDNNLVIDLGGIHASTVKNATIYLTAGEHKVNIFYVDRYQTDAGFNFTTSTSGITFRPFSIPSCGFNYTTVKMELTTWQKV